MSDFEVYRRQLPHWRARQVIYFVTWRLRSRTTPLNPAERTIVADAIQFFHQKRYVLLDFVVMDDHVHVLVWLLPEVELKDTVHSWKSYSANKLQRKFVREGSIWQDKSYDRIIRDLEELKQAQEYIAVNPAKRWPGLADYAWYQHFDALKI